MAEKKISALPAAGTLDGTEKFPVVQAGVTKTALTGTFVRYVTGLPTDGVTVCTTTIQAAIDAAEAGGGGWVHLPDRTLVAPGLVPKPGVNIQGGTLKTNTTDLILAANHTWGFWGTNFVSSSAGGHLFSQTGMAYRSKLLGCTFNQANAAKSVWKSNGHGYIDMLVFEFDSLINSANTVPGWDFVGSGGDVNRNTWQQGRHTYASGAPAFKLDNTGVGAFYYDNVWRDINFEVVPGGGIWLGGVLDPVVENCAIWDTPNATADFISYGPGSGGGLISRGGSFRKLGRRNSTFNAGIYCWASRSTGITLSVHFEGLNGTSAGNLFTVNLNNCVGYTAIFGVWSSFVNGSLGFTTLESDQTITGLKTIQPAAASTVGLIVKGAASQTADLLQVQNSAGTVLSRFNSDGALRTVGAYINTAYNATTMNTTLGVFTNNAAVVAQIIQGAVSQAADLQQWQDSAGTILSSVSSTGDLYVGTTTRVDRANQRMAVGTNSFTFNSTLYVQGIAADVGRVVVGVRGIASQTGALQQWQNSGGTVLASITAAGRAAFTFAEGFRTLELGAADSAGTGFRTVRVAN